MRPRPEMPAKAGTPAAHSCPRRSWPRTFVLRCRRGVSIPPRLSGCRSRRVGEGLARLRGPCGQRAFLDSHKPRGLGTVREDLVVLGGVFGHPRQGPVVLRARRVFLTESPMGHCQEQAVGGLAAGTQVHGFFQGRHAAFPVAIREVYAGTGQITTVAGLGISGIGYGGAIDAQFPLNLGWGEGLSFDSSGDLLISDAQDGRVREILSGEPQSASRQIHKPLPVDCADHAAGEVGQILGDDAGVVDRFDDGSG
jgi:hypothetical protein